MRDVFHDRRDALVPDLAAVCDLARGAARHGGQVLLATQSPAPRGSARPQTAAPRLPRRSPVGVALRVW